MTFDLEKNDLTTSGRGVRRGLVLVAVALLATIFVPAQMPGELSPATAARLKQQIDNGSSEEKRSALFEIRNMRSAEASAIAVPATRDPDVLVRSTAAASVVFLLPHEAASVLIPLLSDKDEFVRREAAYALGKIHHAPVSAALARTMQGDKVAEVRSAAAVALGVTGDVSSIGALVSILKARPREDDEFLRRSAARSIGQIAQIHNTGDRSVITPQNFLPDRFKDLDGGKLDPIGFAEAVNVLISVLRNEKESDDTRREAAYSLGAIGDDKAAPVIRTFVSGEDTYMAEIAREALLKIENRKRNEASSN